MHAPIEYSYRSRPLKEPFVHRGDGGFKLNLHCSYFATILRRFIKVPYYKMMICRESRK